MNLDAVDGAWKEILIDTKKRRAEALEEIADEIEGGDSVGGDEIANRIRTISTEIKGEVKVEKSMEQMGIHPWDMNNE